MATTQIPSLQQNQPKKRTPMPTHDSIVESLRDVGSNVKNTVKHDVAGRIANDAFNSLLGNFPPSESHSGNPYEQPFPGMQRERPQPVQRRQEILTPQRMEYEQKRVQRELEAIRAELAALAQSIGKLNTEIEKAIMEVPVNPGVYHVNFLDRLKRVLKLIRQNVEDSRSWLSVSTDKKKRKGFWGLYKKHGTQFGLSADRTPSTQTG